MLNRHALQQAMEIFTNVWNVIASLIYEYQTLLTGVIAIGAAYYAGRPVWQQLEATNLQSRIMLRDTLASRLREAQVRYQRVAKDLQGKLMDAF